MQPSSASDYKELLTEVIKKQIVILGPDITLSKARNVKGLTVADDGTVTNVEGSAQEVTQALIDQFVQLSGLIVKKTMEPLLNLSQTAPSQTVSPTVPPIVPPVSIPTEPPPTPPIEPAIPIAPTPQPLQPTPEQPQPMPTAPEPQAPSTQPSAPTMPALSIHDPVSPTPVANPSPAKNPLAA